MPFAKVLVPIEFSQPSEAISFIKSIPGVGEIVLLHVVSKGETTQSMESSVKKVTEMLKKHEPKSVQRRSESQYQGGHRKSGVIDKNRRR